MASVDITTLPGIVRAQDITTLLAAGALTITKAQVYKFGSDVVLQLTYSDASIGYFKVKGGRVKVGGADNAFDSGTEVVWNA